MKDHFFLTLNNKRMGLPACALIIGALLTGPGLNASAADVTVQPTAGSSFVVKDSAGVKNRLKVQENGYVGINTISPTNRLQIGDVGSLAGYDIAFGDGVNVSSFLLYPGVVRWDTTGDILLMPKISMPGGLGNGRVGINTFYPNASLEVDGAVSSIRNYEYYAALGNIGYCNSCSTDLSILATNRIAATEFNAYSDVRIKDVVGGSDSADDLKTINALQVTNYTLKDKVKNGNRPFKKVIAQQVENIYPQVVLKHVDFIPNVYQAASKIEKTETGYLLRFDSPHNLTSQAKRVKLLASGDNTMQKTQVVSIPSDSTVIVDLPNFSGDNVFIYGEEVDDFRTVDYEGLTALNISATQELSKQFTQQQVAVVQQQENLNLQKVEIAQQKSDIASIVAEKDAQLADLRNQLAEQKMRVAQLESFADDMAQVKMQLAALRRNSSTTQSLDVALQK
jgi:hypothetical protein